MPFCPQCGVDNPASARYCDQCGTVLVPAPGVTQAPAPAAVVNNQPVASPAAQASGGAVICPQCGTPAIPGEAFCDNCGAALDSVPRPVAPVPQPSYSPGLAPQPQYPPPQQTQASAPAQTAPQPVVAPPSYNAPAVQQPSAQRSSLAPARLTLANGAVLPLPQAAEAVVGRADPASNFTPGVDLGSYGALEAGVGRRHARFVIQSGQIAIEDLDSTNGTTVNGSRLAARQPLLLHDGDEIGLGQLKMRIAF